MTEDTLDSMLPRASDLEATTTPSGRKCLPVHAYIDYNRVLDVLISGLDGGIRYWGHVHRWEIPGGADRSWLADPEFWSGEVSQVYLAPFLHGWIAIAVDDEGPAKRIDLSRLCRALDLMAKKYPRHFADILCGNDDAITGDVLIQLACFEELIYG